MRAAVAEARRDVLPEHLRQKRRLSNEQALWLAVLEDAVECATTTQPAQRGPSGGWIRVNRRACEAARQWIESRDAAPGSFIWVCEILSIEPGPVRGALRDSTACIKKPRAGDYTFLKRPRVLVKRRRVSMGR